MADLLPSFLNLVIGARLAQPFRLQKQPFTRKLNPFGGTQVKASDSGSFSQRRMHNSNEYTRAYRFRSFPSQSFSSKTSQPLYDGSAEIEYWLLEKNYKPWVGVFEGVTIFWVAILVETVGIIFELDRFWPVLIEFSNDGFDFSMSANLFIESVVTA